MGPNGWKLVISECSGWRGLIGPIFGTPLPLLGETRDMFYMATTSHVAVYDFTLSPCSSLISGVPKLPPAIAIAR